MTSVLSILCVDKQVNNKYKNIHKHVITSIVKTSIDMPSFNIIVFHYFWRNISQQSQRVLLERWCMIVVHYKAAYTLIWRQSLTFNL